MVVDAVQRQQFERMNAHATSLWSDRDAHAAQLLEFVETLLRRAVKDPHRLEGYGPQRSEVRKLLRAREAALDQGDARPRPRVVQQRQVLDRTAGVQNGQLHTMPGKDLSIALAELGIAAARPAGRHDDLARNRRIKQC